MSVKTKPSSRLRRRRRVRAKVSGTAQRPRLSVFRSNRGIQAQLIDDLEGHTLAAVNWVEGDLKSLVGWWHFEDLGDRTRVVTTSLFHTTEERDGMLASGMESGLNDTYARLDELLERLGSS